MLGAAAVIASSFVSQRNVDNSVYGISSALRHARIEAIETNKIASVCPGDGKDGCDVGGNWSGWSVVGGYQSEKTVETISLSPNVHAVRIPHIVHYSPDGFGFVDHNNAPYTGLVADVTHPDGGHTCVYMATGTVLEAKISKNTCS